MQSHTGGQIKVIDRSWHDLTQRAKLNPDNVCLFVCLGARGFLCIISICACQDSFNNLWWLLLVFWFGFGLFFNSTPGL